MTDSPLQPGLRRTSRPGTARTHLCTSGSMSGRAAGYPSEGLRPHSARRRSASNGFVQPTPSAAERSSSNYGPPRSSNRCHERPKDLHIGTGRWAERTRRAGRAGSGSACAHQASAAATSCSAHARRTTLARSRSDVACFGHSLPRVPETARIGAYPPQSGPSHR